MSTHYESTYKLDYRPSGSEDITLVVCTTRERLELTLTALFQGAQAIGMKALGEHNIDVINALSRFYVGCQASNIKRALDDLANNGAGMSAGGDEDMGCGCLFVEKVGNKYVLREVLGGGNVITYGALSGGSATSESGISLQSIAEGGSGIGQQFEYGQALGCFHDSASEYLLERARDFARTLQNYSEYGLGAVDWSTNLVNWLPMIGSWVENNSDDVIGFINTFGSNIENELVSQSLADRGAQNLARQNITGAMTREQLQAWAQSFPHTWSASLVPVRYLLENWARWAKLEEINAELALIASGCGTDNPVNLANLPYSGGGYLPPSTGGGGTQGEPWTESFSFAVDEQGWEIGSGGYALYQSGAGWGPTAEDPDVIVIRYTLPDVAILTGVSIVASSALDSGAFYVGLNVPYTDQTALVQQSSTTQWDSVFNARAVSWLECGLDFSIGDRDPYTGTIVTITLAGIGVNPFTIL